MRRGVGTGTTQGCEDATRTRDPLLCRGHLFAKRLGVGHYVASQRLGIEPEVSAHLGNLPVAGDELLHALQILTISQCCAQFVINPCRRSRNGFGSPLRFFRRGSGLCFAGAQLCSH